MWGGKTRAFKIWMCRPIRKKRKETRLEVSITTDQKVTYKEDELSEKQLADRESSRESVARTSKWVLKFLGRFKNGMVWNNSNEPYLDLKEGVFHMVGGGKNSHHIIPVGGTMWDRISVPTRLVKIIRRVRE